MTEDSPAQRGPEGSPPTLSEATLSMTVYAVVFGKISRMLL